MNSIVLFNPSIATSNIGDRIIFKYCDEEIKKVFADEPIIEFPTQMPVSRKISNRFKETQYRFICGSNLLQSNMALKIGRKGVMTHDIRQWDISLSNVRKYAPVILLGVGWQNYNSKVNLYTKKLWKSVLSEKYIHSVRDEFTLDVLKSIGIENVVNTGCPTTWALTPDFCKDIPIKKAQNVVTTITDYRQDIQRDETMLQVLIENYDKVWLWLQGIGDADYFNTLNKEIRKKIILVGPQLEHYHNLLINNDIDYVGTRLHGGIYALNHKKRAIIIGIDNRAIEMNKDINLKVVRQDDINELACVIQSVWKTDIKIHERNIELFLKQF